MSPSPEREAHAFISRGPLVLKLLNFVFGVGVFTQASDLKSAVQVQYSAFSCLKRKCTQGVGMRPASLPFAF